MTHRKVVVLISGKAGAGKSTFAKYLEQDAIIEGLSCVRTAFADALKDIAYDNFGWDGKKDEKGRRLLQNLGDVGRSYNTDLWVNKVKDKILEHIPLKDTALYIIDDCRYLNEISFVDKTEGIGCVKIHIIRPDNPHALTGERAAHSSENGLNKYTEYDREFFNHGEGKEQLSVLAHDVLLDIMAGLLGDAK